jgi:hypothetical protein
MSTPEFSAERTIGKPGSIYGSKASSRRATGLVMANPLGDCLAGCRDSYLECTDDCRENSPGDPGCYADCNRGRDSCERSCYEECR